MLTEIAVGLIGLVSSLINIYIWIIIISALLSFVNPDPYNPVVQFLYRITEPAYAFVRRYIPTTIGMVDLAPFVIIIVLQILMIVLNSIAHSLVY